MSYPELQPVEASRTHGDGGERLCISITTPCKVEWPKMKGATLQVAQNNGNLTATTANSATPNAARASEKPPSPLRCPRCDSANTKFCYYNNYSLSQPRHFCKACKRYWTRGGTLRNVPVGGGCRKNKRSSAAKKPPSRGRPLLIPSPPGQPRLDGAAELYAMQVASAPFSSSPSLPISVLSGDLLPHLGGLGLGGSPAAGSEPTARVLDDYPNALLGSGSSFLPLDQGYEELAALQLSFGELQGLAMMKDVKLGGQIVNNNNSINSFSVCNNNWQMTPPDNSLEESLGMYCLNANAGGWPEFYGRI